MTGALIGLLGVLVGLVMGASFNFWSTRREEMAAALTGASVLTEQLRAQRANGPTGGPGDLAGLEAAWDEHRSSLICHLRPSDYTTLADRIAIALGDGPSDLDHLAGTMNQITDLFWQEHQSLPTHPFLNFIRGRTVSARLSAIVAGGGSSTPNR